MFKSKDSATRLILKILGEKKSNELKDFCLNISEQPYREFCYTKEIEQIISLQYKSQKDYSPLKEYSGYRYNLINSSLRNKWSYDKCGKFSYDKIIESKKTADEIHNLLQSSCSLSENICSYRGVDIKSYKNFEVNSIQDLKFLSGQFVFEQSFISSSLIRKNSFFNKDLDYHDPCNIEVKYIVPSSFHDGIPLINDSLSYSPNQTEFLMDKGTLSYVVDTKIDDETNTAQLTQVVIPKQMYESQNQNSDHTNPLNEKFTEQ